MLTREATSQIEVLIKGQNEVLKMITHGKSLTAVLNRLTLWVEDQFGSNILASVLCIDPSGQHLFHCGGTRFSQDYIEAINGLKIGPKAGSCGTAAYLKKPVIVEDIEENELWADFKKYALKHNLRACWSIPLINHDGEVKGTFALYYHEPKSPSDHEMQLISLFAQTALTAIEYHNKEKEREFRLEAEKIISEQIKKSAQRFQNLVREASVGIVVLKGENFIIDVVNEQYGKLVNLTVDEMLHQPIFDLIPDAADPFKKILDSVRITGEQITMDKQPYSIIDKNGQQINGYLNLIYQPYREEDGTISGVIALCHDVTEIVLANKKLQQNEAEFRNLVMQAPVAIVVLKGRDLIVELVNESYLKIAGRSKEQLLKKSLYEALPEAKDEIKAIADKIYETGEAVMSSELKLNLIRHNKQEPAYFNAIWKPNFNIETNEMEGFTVVVVEVTDIVLARKKHQESEQHIRAVIESAPFPIGVFVGKEMIIQFANQSIKDAWGKGNNVEGKSYFEILPELESQNIYAQLDGVYTTGKAFHAKRQRVDLAVDGILKPFYFNYSLTPLFDKEGNVYGVINTAADVTELMNAYQSLEEAESRARIAMEASEQGNFDVNLETNEMLSSPRIAEIFEMEGEVTREILLEKLDPADVMIRKLAYQNAFKTGILNYESRIIVKNNFVKWIRVKGKIFFKDDEPNRLLGVIQDITEQKRFSEALEKKVEERTLELQKLNHQLIEINEELQQFAYISSHDLQEPLRKIRIFTDILLRQNEKTEDTDIFLQKISASAERMSGLIRSLLDYSRMSNLKVKFVPVDLNEVLKNVITDFELLIAQKQAVIKIDALPEIEGLPLQLNQLFFNLIGNALKFSEEGKSPHIHITSYKLNSGQRDLYPELDFRNEYVAIQIADNGIGFDQNYASKIFAVFQRLNDRNYYQGYGVGLALCKKVTQAHNGLILAEGKLKEGARFTVILPVKQYA